MSNDVDAEPLDGKKQSHSHVEAHYSADDVAAAVQHLKKEIDHLMTHYDWVKKSNKVNDDELVTGIRRDVLGEIDEAFADVVDNAGGGL